jgi:hypothetical protein
VQCYQRAHTKWRKRVLNITQLHVNDADEPLKHVCVCVCEAEGRPRHTTQHNTTQHNTTQHNRLTMSSWCSATTTRDCTPATSFHAMGHWLHASRAHHRCNTRILVRVRSDVRRRALPANEYQARCPQQAVSFTVLHANCKAQIQRHGPTHTLAHRHALSLALHVEPEARRESLHSNGQTWKEELT